MAQQVTIKEMLNAASSLLVRSAAELAPEIERASAMLVEALRCGRCIFFAGNGGSATEAEHLAGELLGRYKAERRPLPAVALGTDLGVLTAIANDYGYTDAFARQFEGLARQGDVLVILSTSGDSANLIELLRRASARQVRSIGLLGRDGGRCRDLVDLPIVVPSDDVARIQEVHLVIGHSLCAEIDAALGDPIP